MSVDPALASLELSVVVKAPVVEAFELFTSRMGEWWPLDVASYGGDRAREIFLEPRVGGRFFERFTDGDELQVGTVTVCQPPRLISFTWVTADWLGETVVDVRFSPEADGTRVDLSHHGFERIGPVGPDVAAKFRNGWPRVLRAFTEQSAR